jgi:diguanylate cyclase (GGDEF)-like protein
LSPFTGAQGQELASLTVTSTAPAAGAFIVGRISLAQLLGDRASEGSLPFFLVDQNGRTVGSGGPESAGLQSLPIVRTAAGAQGQFVDLVRLRALPAVTEVQGGWLIAVPGAAPDLGEREAALMRRFIMGGALSLCLGLVLLHFVAQRLRSEIDDVVTDFGDLEGEAPNSVISEFAVISGVLASARAKAGRTAIELERAKHDSLTGLAGRELFMQQAQAQQHVARTMDDHGLAMLYIDLDGFKAVNDTRGHKAGDQLLREVAATLRHCVRSPDAVGRTGGDEFVVCFAAPRHHLSELASRACERISEEVSRLGTGVGCSIGWATAAADCNLLELIDEADAAMYLAKSARKHRMRMEAGAKA